MQTHNFFHKTHTKKLLVKKLVANTKKNIILTIPTDSERGNLECRFIISILILP